MPQIHVTFDAASDYERVMGQWSRLIGERFLDWLAPPPGLRWLDIGCGTGAFSAIILKRCAPKAVAGIDPAPAQIEHARKETPQAEFRVADATALPFGDGDFDAVYLSLHGAMVVQGMDGADFEIVRQVRETIGPAMPLGVSLDLHANLDPRLAGLMTFAAGYKEHPHTDMSETAQRVLEGLRRVLAGEIRPVGHIAKLDAILPSINMRTAEGPMAEVEAFARVAGPSSKVVRWREALARYEGAPV